MNILPFVNKFASMGIEVRAITVLTADFVRFTCVLCGEERHLVLSADDTPSTLVAFIDELVTKAITPLTLEA